MTHLPRLVAGAAALAMTALTACSTSEPTARAEPRPYPEMLRPVRSLNIQVYRTAQHIELTNTTAQDFGPSTLWINGEFSRPINGFAIGQMLRIPLRSFVNEFDETFRAGGFFATELPEPLVLAQLETTAAGPNGAAEAEGADERTILYGLVVVKGNEESL